MDLNIKPVNWTEQAKKLKTSYVVTALLLGLIVSPIIFMVLKGLVGLIIAAVVLLSVSAAAGPMGQKLANMRLAAMKKEALTHAKEQLQNEFLRRQTALDNMRKSLEQLIGRANTMMAKGRENIKKYPDDDSYPREVDAISQLLSLRKTKYAETVDAVKAFKHQVDRAVDKLEFADMAREIRDAAGVISDPLQEILASTSLAAAENAMNAAFADLEITLVNEAPQQLLKAAPAVSRIPLTIVQEEPVLAQKGT